MIHNSHTLFKVPRLGTSFAKYDMRCIYYLYFFWIINITAIIYHRQGLNVTYLKWKDHHSRPLLSKCAYSLIIILCIRYIHYNILYNMHMLLAWMRVGHFNIITISIANVHSFSRFPWWFIVGFITFFCNGVTGSWSITVNI